MVTSLIIVDNIQHEPIKKLTTELQERQMQKTVIDSAMNAIEYPSGVFQLNGNLKNQKMTHFFEPGDLRFCEKILRSHCKKLDHLNFGSTKD